MQKRSWEKRANKEKWWDNKCELKKKQLIEVLKKSRKVR